jgi:hypothetical protein
VIDPFGHNVICIPVDHIILGISVIDDVFTVSLMCSDNVAFSYYYFRANYDGGTVYKDEIYIGFAVSDGRNYHFFYNENVWLFMSNSIIDQQKQDDYFLEEPTICRGPFAPEITNNLMRNVMDRLNDLYQGREKLGQYFSEFQVKSSELDLYGRYNGREIEQLGHTLYIRSGDNLKTVRLITDDPNDFVYRLHISIWYIDK